MGDQDRMMIIHQLMGELVSEDRSYAVALAELAGTVITTYVVVITALTPVRREARRARTAAETAADTPATASDDIARQLREIARDIGGIREEIRTERRERLSFERDMRDKLKGNP